MIASIRAGSASSSWTSAVSPPLSTTPNKSGTSAIAQWNRCATESRVTRVHLIFVSRKLAPAPSDCIRACASLQGAMLDQGRGRFRAARVVASKSAGTTLTGDGEFAGRAPSHRHSSGGPNVLGPACDRCMYPGVAPGYWCIRGFWNRTNVDAKAENSRLLRRYSMAPKHPEPYAFRIELLLEGLN